MLASGAEPAGKNGRQLVLEQLHVHKTHELIPRSGKVVAFDLDLSLRHALDALAEHHVGYAPLWDSARQEFVTVIACEDFARLLSFVGREAVHGGGAALGRSPDDISLRDVLRMSRPAAPPPIFPSLQPDESLFAAVQAMLTRVLYHLPLVDSGNTPSPASAAASAVAAAAAGASATGGAGATIVHILTPLRVLNCIVNSPMFQSDSVRLLPRLETSPPCVGAHLFSHAECRAPTIANLCAHCGSPNAHRPMPTVSSPLPSLQRMFGERLVDLGMCTMLPTPQSAPAVIAAGHAAAGIGDPSVVVTSLDAAAHGGTQGSGVCVAALAHAPLWHALVLMGQYRCALLPVIDVADSAVVVSAITEERVLAIARSMPHTDLNMPLMRALGAQPPSAGEVCVRATDSLHAVMAALTSRNCERLAVTSDAGQLVGVVTVLDVLKYVCHTAP